MVGRKHAVGLQLSVHKSELQAGMQPQVSPLTAAWRGRALRMADGETLPMQHPAHGLGSAPGPMRKPEAMDAALVYSYGRLSLVRT